MNSLIWLLAQTWGICYVLGFGRRGNRQAFGNAADLLVHSCGGTSCRCQLSEAEVQGNGVRKRPQEWTPHQPSPSIICPWSPSNALKHVMNNKSFRLWTQFHEFSFLSNNKEHSYISCIDMMLIGIFFLCEPHTYYFLLFLMEFIMKIHLNNPYYEELST